jgi:hypothetical protein
MWLGRKEFTEIMTALTELKVESREIKADLKEHIRRTANLEGRTESIEVHVHQVRGIFKFLAMVGGTLTVLGAIGGVLVSFWTT